MKTKTCFFALLMPAFGALLCGCNDKPPAAIPAAAAVPCDQIETVTDPARKAELASRCFHGGPPFKPSPVKKW